MRENARAVYLRANVRIYSESIDDRRVRFCCICVLVSGCYVPSFNYIASHRTVCGAAHKNDASSSTVTGD